MKHNCLILAGIVIVCTLLLLIGCQEQTDIVSEPKTDIKQLEQQTTPPKAEPVAETEQLEPGITFEKVVHDFGQVGPGVGKNCEFKFTNTGDGILKIGKIRSTCGCTVPKLARSEYASGESGTIKVVYHSGAHAGSVSRLLYVPSNDKANPKVKLTIKANIKLQVAYEPKKLELSLKDANAASPPVKLHSIDGKPFAITGYNATADSITFDYDPSVKKTEFVLQPTLNMEKLKMGLKGRVNINLTHPSCKSITIPFEVLARFKFNSPAMIVFNAEPNTPVKKELWLLNNYNEDFEVESASSKKNIIKVVKQEKLGSRYKFELEITPPPALENKTRMFKDVFSVKIKDGEELDIVCRGFYPRK